MNPGDELVDGFLKNWFEQCHCQIFPLVFISLVTLYFLQKRCITMKTSDIWVSYSNNFSFQNLESTSAR